MPSEYNMGFRRFPWPSWIYVSPVLPPWLRHSVHHAYQWVTDTHGVQSQRPKVQEINANDDGLMIHTWYLYCYLYRWRWVVLRRKWYYRTCCQTVNTMWSLEQLVLHHVAQLHLLLLSAHCQVFLYYYYYYYSSTTTNTHVFSSKWKWNEQVSLLVPFSKYIVTSCFFVRLINTLTYLLTYLHCGA